jgi:hypothetical protein
MRLYLCRLYIFIIFLLNPNICFSEVVACPLNMSEHKWMDKRIAKEFQPFGKDGIRLEDIDNVMASNSSEFNRFKIINSKVYGPNIALKNLLITMTKLYKVPDVDFIYYCADVLTQYSPIFRDKKTAPIFVSAKNKNLNRVVLFVDWYYDILSEKKSGWNGLIEDILKNKSTWPWEKKINKLFWRGVPSDGGGIGEIIKWAGYPRGKIVYLSHFVAPQDIDASFAGACLDDPAFILAGEFKKHVPCSNMVSQIDHLQYKYQLVMDGVTSTWPGYQWRLLSGCVSFKQETDEIMWFYDALLPWVHYIPFKKDCSDILERIHWAQSHDRKAKKIAKNAQHFALNNLMPEHILLYCYKSLLKYASLQRFSPTVTEEEQSS